MTRRVTELASDRYIAHQSELVTGTATSCKLRADRLTGDCESLLLPKSSALAILAACSTSRWCDARTPRHDAHMGPVP